MSGRVSLMRVGCWFLVELLFSFVVLVWGRINVR